MRNNRLFPALGLLFVPLVIVGFAIAGEPPDPTEDPVSEIVEFYRDNDTEQWIALGVLTLALFAFLVFTVYLRSILRAAEGPQGGLSVLLLVGAGIFATGVAVDGTITIALTESAEDIEPTAVQALSALWHNDFVPIATGAMVWLFTIAVSSLRHGAVPKWLGGLALLLLVIAFTPAGFVSFLGTGVFIIILSIYLLIREGRGDAGTGPPPAEPTTPA